MKFRLGIRTWRGWLPHRDSSRCLALEWRGYITRQSVETSLDAAASKAHRKLLQIRGYSGGLSWISVGRRPIQTDTSVRATQATEPEIISSRTSAPHR